MAYGAVGLWPFGRAGLGIGDFVFSHVPETTRGSQENEVENRWPYLSNEHGECQAQGFVFNPVVGVRGPVQQQRLLEDELCPGEIDGWTLQDASPPGASPEIGDKPPGPRSATEWCGVGREAVGLGGAVRVEIGSGVRQHSILTAFRLALAGSPRAGWLEDELCPSPDTRILPAACIPSTRWEKVCAAFPHARLCTRAKHEN